MKLGGSSAKVDTESTTTLQEIFYENLFDASSKTLLKIITTNVICTDASTILRKNVHWLEPT
jgi:hypothetical protein